MSPISAAIVNAEHPADPRHGRQQRDVGVVGAAGPQLALDRVDLGLRGRRSARGWRRPSARHGSGISRRSSSSRPSSPNRSVTGQGCPKAISVAWMRFLSIDLCSTRCSRNRACSRSARTRGSGSQIAGTRSRRESTASTQASILSVLHASGARPLTLCASAIRTPSRLLERVVHEPSTGHRLDHRPHGLAELRATGARGSAARRYRAAPRAPRPAPRSQRAGRRQGVCDLDLIQRATCERASSRLVLGDKRSLPPRRPSFIVQRDRGCISWSDARSPRKSGSCRAPSHGVAVSMSGYDQRSARLRRWSASAAATY